LKREQAMQLNGALSDKELKVKFLSGPQYASLIGLKRPLTKYLSEMGENEKALAEEMNITIGHNGFISDDKNFLDKLKEIQKVEFTPKELNFIPMEEFKKWTDEVDFNTGSILAEYLLKS